MFLVTSIFFKAVRMGILLVCTLCLAPDLWAQSNSSFKVSDSIYQEINKVLEIDTVELDGFLISTLDYSRWYFIPKDIKTIFNFLTKPYKEKTPFQNEKIYTFSKQNYMANLKPKLWSTKLKNDTFKLMNSLITEEVWNFNWDNYIYKNKTHKQAYYRMAFLSKSKWLRVKFKSVCYIPEGFFLNEISPNSYSKYTYVHVLMSVPIVDRPLLYSVKGFKEIKLKYPR
jgi:hypothetical protein